MKVYVGRFTYIYDNDTDIVVATTVERVEQELLKKAQDYLRWMGDDFEQGLIPNNFNEIRDIGWEYEWFDLQWVQTDVLSDGHILKYAMETI